MRDREGGREGTILQSYYKDTVYRGKPLKEKCFYELQTIRKIFCKCLTRNSLLISGKYCSRISLFCAFAKNFLSKFLAIIVYVAIM